MARESIVYQVTETMKTLISFGQSKHSTKTEFLKTYDGGRGIDKFMASFAKTDGIHAITTFKDYLSIAISAARYAKENFGIRNIQNLTKEHIQSFLQLKISENPAKSTIKKYSAALEKLETALERKYEKKFDFEIKTGLLQEKEKLEKLQTKERSGYYCYENPTALLKNIEQNKNIPESHKIALSVAAETGSRFHKTMTVSGIRQDVNGFFTAGKGGRIELFQGLNSMTEKTADRLNTYLKESGKETFKLSGKDYKKVLIEIEKAAISTHQHYEGLHGLKKNFAKDVRKELIESGMTYKETIDSKEYQYSLAHNRHLSTYERG